MTRYSNDQIIETLKNLAERLGQKRLSKKDVAAVISTSTVANRFGNLGNALEAAGLERTASGENFKGKGPRITDEDLFKALYEVETRIGREPGFTDCSSKCRYSVKPYIRRFGKWPDVRARYKKWKSENESMLPSILSHETTNDGEESVRNGKGEKVEVRTPMPSIGTSKKKAPEQFYGEPIDFRGLRHAPINEQGVVFLFAMVSRELGFNIESVQQGFPDCEGKYLFDPKKNLWAKARIEFEYKASNFEQHGHDPDQCDFIVCWVNDWPECPVNVIELKTEILKLPSR
jgi:hypothetical protein